MVFALILEELSPPCRPHAHREMWERRHYECTKRPSVSAHVQIFDFPMYCQLPVDKYNLRKRMVCPSTKSQALMQCIYSWNSNRPCHAIFFKWFPPWFIFYIKFPSHRFTQHNLLNNFIFLEKSCKTTSSCFNVCVYAPMYNVSIALCAQFLY